MLRYRITSQEIIRLDIDELRTKRTAVAQDHRGHLPREDFLIHAYFGGESINRAEKQTIDSAREKAPDGSLFAFGNIQGVCEQKIITQLVRAFLKRKHDAGENRV